MTIKENLSAAVDSQELITRHQAANECRLPVNEFLGIAIARGVSPAIYCGLEYWWTNEVREIDEWLNGSRND